jgi:hypothetical protein
MTNVVATSYRAASREIIDKLVRTGYLQPTLRNHPAAITSAIARLKQDLRAGATSEDDGPQAAMANCQK